MSHSALLDEMLDPLTHCLDTESAKRIVAFRFAPSVQERFAALAERANAGGLAEDERTEYEALINAADLIAILKLKAQRRLPSNVNLIHHLKRVVANSVAGRTSPSTWLSWATAATSESDRPSRVWTR